MQPSDLDWPLTTERLRIRPAVPADAPAMFAYRSQEAVSRWLPSLPLTLESWSQHLAERLATTLVIEHDEALVGDLYVALRDPWSQDEVRQRAAGTVAEIGYVLDPAYAGQGYATEAVRALLGVAFDGLGVRRVIAECFADNVASWRLMERVGMRREQHTVKDSLHRDGEWFDGMMYALLREEWVGSR